MFNSSLEHLLWLKDGRSKKEQQGNTTSKESENDLLTLFNGRNTNQEQYSAGQQAYRNPMFADASVPERETLPNLFDRFPEPRTPWGVLPPLTYNSTMSRNMLPPSTYNKEGLFARPTALEVNDEGTMPNVFAESRKIVSEFVGSCDPHDSNNLGKDDESQSSEAYDEFSEASRLGLRLMSPSLEASPPLNYVQPVVRLRLLPLTDSLSFQTKQLSFRPDEEIKVGRISCSRNQYTPRPDNGVFDCSVMSREHAMLKEENGKIYIKDLDSTHGTFLNSTRVSASQPYELCNGDVLTFGSNVTRGQTTYKQLCAYVWLSRPDVDQEEGPTGAQISNDITSSSFVITDCSFNESEAERDYPGTENELKTEDEGEDYSNHDPVTYASVPGPITSDANDSVELLTQNGPSGGYLLLEPEISRRNAEMYIGVDETDGVESEEEAAVIGAEVDEESFVEGGGQDSDSSESLQIVLNNSVTINAREDFNPVEVVLSGGSNVPVAEREEDSEIAEDKPTSSDDEGDVVSEPDGFSTAEEEQIASLAERKEYNKPLTPPVSPVSPLVREEQSNEEEKKVEENHESLAVDELNVEVPIVATEVPTITLPTEVSSDSLGTPPNNDKKRKREQSDDEESDDAANVFCTGHISENELRTRLAQERVVVEERARKRMKRAIAVGATIGAIVGGIGTIFALGI